MTSLREDRGTAGNGTGHGTSANPVICDSDTIQYNLDIGTYTFTVQVADVLVKFILQGICSLLWGGETPSSPLSRS